MEPDPDDRQHRVGFKAELVDMVAPPPDVSDDDDTPRRTLSGASHENKAGKETEGGGDKKKQYVIEREGKFDFVADNELTADERAMLSLPDEDGSSKTDINSNSSLHDNKERVQPVPPSKPRPNTASSVSLRGVRSSHSPRPKTASFNCSASSATSLRDFQYNSPYAMSPNEKERALERARWVCMCLLMRELFFLLKLCLSILLFKKSVWMFTRQNQYKTTTKKDIPLLAKHVFLF